MISEPAQYLLNSTDSPYGRSKQELKYQLISMYLALGGETPSDEEFDRIFNEARESGQMSEWDGLWYSNERFVEKDVFTKLMY